MGGAVSQGADNQELVDNLVKGEYIREHSIEKAFRLVDRGDYFLPGFRGQAYKDLAWRQGNLHLSAPCIYAEVLSNLELERGNSLLNVGSGAGYLSTVAGVLMGSEGVNHGVELHEDVVCYAEKHVEDILGSGIVDIVDVCLPVFLQGNIFDVQVDEVLGAYDRVYCGAAVQPQHIAFFKALVKVGGILILPTDEELIKVRRVSLDSYNETNLMPVAFAGLVLPEEQQLEPKTKFTLPKMCMRSLKERCRDAIRECIRLCVNIELPNAIVVNVVANTTQTGADRNVPRRRIIRHVVFPATDDEDVDPVDPVIRLHMQQQSDNDESLDALTPGVRDAEFMEDEESDMQSDSETSGEMHIDESARTSDASNMAEDTTQVNVNYDNEVEQMHRDELIKHNNNIKLVSHAMIDRVARLPLPPNLRVYVNLQRSLPTESHLHNKST